MYMIQIIDIALMLQGLTTTRVKLGNFCVNCPDYIHPLQSSWQYTREKERDHVILMVSLVTPLQINLFVEFLSEFRMIYNEIGI